MTGNTEALTSRLDETEDALADVDDLLAQDPGNSEALQVPDADW